MMRKKKNKKAAAGLQLVKVVEVLVTIVLGCLFLWSVKGNFEKYLQAATTVTQSTIEDNTLTFPVITLCHKQGYKVMYLMA